MSSDSSPARSQASTRALALAAIWMVVCAALIYVPDIGRGFIKDDYGWIASSHVTSWDALRRLFTETPMGFYRPLVSLSFALNEHLSPRQPLAYALVNLALVFAIAGAIALLARRLGLAAGAALFAAGVWMFNFHGINMSLLWVSGRTSLLGTLGAVLAANAFVSSHFILSGLLMLVALLGKEEPLLLPLVWAIWISTDGVIGTGSGLQAPGSSRSWRQAFTALWPSLAAVALYLAMRAQTDALTPATAPDFYRFSARAIAGNAVQYLDRSLTFTAALLLLGAAGLSRARLFVTPLERTIAVKGAAWLVLGFGLTIMVPVRSSLYVCLPAVGSALIAGALGSAWWRAMARPRLALAVLMVLPIALLPVYRSRNARIRNEAVLASNVLATVAQAIARSHPARIVIVDSGAERPSMAAAFGDTLPLALRLFVPEAATVDIVAHPDAGQIVTGDITYIVHDGRLIAQ